MKPTRGSKNLRTRRFSEVGAFYSITTATVDREPLLKTPTCARLVINVFQWLEDQGRIEIFALVVMPDHVHGIFELKLNSPSKVVHSLKSFSANKINEALGRTGPVWQPQYFERRVRSEKELRERARYILENPVRKGLVMDERDYLYFALGFSLD